MTAINKVLEKICIRVPLPGSPHHEGFRLKDTSPYVTQIIMPKIAEQKTLFGVGVLATALDHDQIITLIQSHAKDKGYDVHIGETEQDKNPEMKSTSSHMINPQQYGLPSEVFGTITEIDMLLLKGTSITHAFEVATTVETANKAINDRFRNLFVASPNLLVKAYVVVKDKDFGKAHKTLFSKANITDGIAQKVKIIRLSELVAENLNELLAM